MKKQNLKNKLKKIMSATLALSAFVTATGVFNTFASYSPPKSTSPSSDRQKNLNGIAAELKTAWDSYVSQKKRIEEQFEGNFSKYKKEKEELLAQKKGLEAERDGFIEIISSLEKLDFDFLTDFKKNALNDLYKHYKNIFSCYASSYNKEKNISKHIIRMCRAFIANLGAKKPFSNPFLNSSFFECQKLLLGDVKSSIITSNRGFFEYRKNLDEPESCTQLYNLDKPDEISEDLVDVFYSYLGSMTNNSDSQELISLCALVHSLLKNHFNDKKPLVSINKRNQPKPGCFFVKVELPIPADNSVNFGEVVRFCQAFADLTKFNKPFFYHKLFETCYAAFQESSDIICNLYNELKSKIPKEYKNQPINEDLAKEFCFKELADELFGSNDEMIRAYLNEQEKVLNSLKAGRDNFQKELAEVEEKIAQKDAIIKNCEEFKKAPEENVFVKHYYKNLQAKIEEILLSKLLPNPLNGESRENDFIDRKTIMIGKQEKTLDNILKEHFGDNAIVIEFDKKQGIVNKHLADHLKNKSAIIENLKANPNKTLSGKFNIEDSRFASCANLRQLLQEQFNNSIIVVSKYETQKYVDGVFVPCYSYVCYIFDCNTGKFITTGKVYDKEKDTWSPAQAIVFVTDTSGKLVTAHPRLIR